jgi:hypothetical protein
MRYLILALLLVGLSGCASSQRQLAQFYRTGMTRSEVRASFPVRPEPFVSAVRQASGWQNARPDQFRRGFIYPQIGMEALAFERSHATSVSACDV